MSGGAGCVWGLLPGVPPSSAAENARNLAAGGLFARRRGDRKMVKFRRFLVDRFTLSSLKLLLRLEKRESCAKRVT